MKNLKNAFLFVSLVSFAIALTSVGPAIVVDLSAPVAAIMFGLFLIHQFTEKESALYDAQNRQAGAHHEDSSQTEHPAFGSAQHS